VINEIIQNPSAVFDSNGEWFELYNPTGSAIDINGWTIKDNDSDSHVIANGGPLMISAGGYLVLGRNADSGTNGGVTVAYQYSGISLGNSADELVLMVGSTEIDRVEWDGGPGFPDPNGASMSLIDPALDNNAGANWCTAATPFGAGDLGTPGSANDCPTLVPEVVINEIIQNPAAVSDTDGEWFEIYNPTSSAIDINGWTIKDNDTDSHVIANGGPLMISAGGYLVLGRNADSGTNGGVTVAYQYEGIFLGNSGDELILMDGSTEIDRVEWDGGPGFPDPTGASMSLFNPSLDNNTGANWCTATTTFGAGDLGTPGSANDCPSTGPVLEIFEIQGAGSASAYDGQSVTTVDNIVTAVGPEGFTIQTPDARDDGLVDTSNGIYVFTGGAPTVSVGDLVDVTGGVTEFFGFTEFSAGSLVTINGSGALPAATIFDATVPSPDPMAPSCAMEFECYEGMLVEITGGSVTGPNQRFSTDTVAEVHITAASERTYRETGIEYMGLPGLPEWDGNPEVFELDPDRLGLANQIIPAGSHFDATGVIGFEFGGYELWPSSLTVYPATIPQTVRAREVAEMTVGALNLFRLFDDVDDAPIPRFDPDTNTTYPPATDDTVVDALEYARRLAKFSDFIRNVLMAPDILAVSEVESLTVLQDLADEINADDPSLVYTPYLEEGNDIGSIDVGFLVLDTVEVDAVTQLGRFEILDFDGSLLNDRPPLLLEARQVSDGSDFPIAVIAIHGRSLGSIDSTSSGERVRAKRLAQAQFVAAEVQALQDANPDINLVVTGDFNAFEFTDAYVDVTGHMKGDFVAADNLVCTERAPACDFDPVDPDLINQVLMIPEGERYSFIFRGNAQTLDHALTSSGLDELVRDFSYGRGNADAAVDLLNDDSTVLRSSDHDGLVLFLIKDSDGDGVTDNLDVCPGTVIPESAAGVRLVENRFALVDDDRKFDTKPPRGTGPQVTFDLDATAGCSCEQIVEAQHLGGGHLKFGCSLGAMHNWLEAVSQP
jgi:predicted extracellular nuclease